MHLDGLSYRDIADMERISKSRVHRICQNRLTTLPDNNKLTFNYCSKSSGVFEFDGKYIPIKGYAKKIPLLWGIDYHKHDFPVFLLASSESYESWATFFQYLRIVNMYPEYIVCDDNSPLKIAARHAFPNVKIQTCYNHEKEKVRRELKTRSDDRYKKFSSELDLLLSKKRSTHDFNKRLQWMYDYHGNDPLVQDILLNIEKRKHEFLAFQGVKGAPETTNMIESFNSQLEDRIRPLHHFNSFHHAKLWLNGYILKRRLTPFRNCKGRFRYLNGKVPLRLTQKPNVIIPNLF